MAARKERAAPAKRTPNAVSNSTPAVSTSTPQTSPEDVRKLVSEAAYYRAKRRGFAPGHELEDWVQAEAEVLQRLNSPRTAA
ncbi:MAG TPA: DUF2934 domain-containing protein [Burkholderiales bacterium]|jgi:hypothetical protein|nr:DUF2934 domain-containing protein [Burkholderiales bacterium]